ncbi:carboxyl transferase [Phycisphaera mikurensis]|uniref:Putative carboxyltransferase n=1 Tax=Phycisphaera mikurensis (strain NBRC 102666 / KCTC 22515 / FYK2301M01) TaxID=1142394 RepID=I0IEN8_PHYMF|nr:carboxyl transferase [Phycisphaera mikurensis]MBB6441524.1 pyruvate/oxaloacetate carboxyltransferase [Phycisphaera mikurensis]BAM03726.1 putative carboxyltransferase [Phycisphaera mikurensis NBRC 102666]
MPAPSDSVRFVDCSLRDGHQSLLATRMSGSQVEAVLPHLARAGYERLELWGGAVPDASLRFTHEDPFERLDRARAALDLHAPRDRPVQVRSLCRGQNLFGYSPYPDNVVTAFLKEAVRSGSAPANAADAEAPARRNKPHGAGAHRIRVFDALNDARNLVTATMATKAFNGEVEAALCYTTSPVHTPEAFSAFAVAAVDAGADALAIKDMAGLLHPADVAPLVAALRVAAPGLELTLHVHCTTGLGVAACVAGLLCGVDCIDTGHGPLAGGSAQPPVELMCWFADRLGVRHGLDAGTFPAIDAAMRAARTELAHADGAAAIPSPWPLEPGDDDRRALAEALALLRTGERPDGDAAVWIIDEELMRPRGYPAADTTHLDSQIPGGMISNLESQLRDQGKIELLPEILEEVPRVRAAAGYPPLVTPTSQIVGSQAAFNVMLQEPYKQVSMAFRDLLTGRYGRLPGPVDPAVLKIAAGDTKPFRERPADLIPDASFNALLQRHGGRIRSHRDLLLLLLFPQPAGKFLERRAAASAT